MWGSRTRAKSDDERYESRTADRLRGVGHGGSVVSDTDPEVIRARLERMRHGASRSLGKAHAET